MFLHNCLILEKEVVKRKAKNRIIFLCSKKRLSCFSLQEGGKIPVCTSVCKSRPHLYAEIIEGEQKARGALIGNKKQNKNRIQIN